jgi:hypothetical protein
MSFAAAKAGIKAWIFVVVFLVLVDEAHDQATPLVLQ